LTTGTQSFDCAIGGCDGGGVGDFEDVESFVDVEALADGVEDFGDVGVCGDWNGNDVWCQVVVYEVDVERLLETAARCCV